MSDQLTIGTTFTHAARKTLSDSLRTIEHCFSQISDEDAWWRPFPQANSIGNIVLHLAGNLGQWIVSGIGGAPDVRKRPAEFAERGPVPREQLLKRLRDVVIAADRALSQCPPDDLLRIRHVQHWDITGVEAIFNTVSHFVGHTHQIVYVTRLQLGDRYKFLGLDAKSD
jgi:hypothetical protein